MKQKISRNFAKQLQTRQFASKPYEDKANLFDIVQYLGFLRLDINFPFQDLLQEIQSIPAHLFTDHRTQYNENQGWKSFTLHGAAYNATTEEQNNTDMLWTDKALEFCPNTVKYFQTQWPAVEFGRVRIMLLEPGGVIDLHKDVSDTSEYQAVNIAVTQPEQCKFYLDNFGIVPFVPGSVFLIDISNLHTVINDSSENRYHIIVHHKKSTKEFDSLIRKSYNNIYASKINNP